MLEIILTNVGAGIEYSQCDKTKREGESHDEDIEAGRKKAPG